MVKSGDTIILKKTIGPLKIIGQRCVVNDIKDGVIGFSFGTHGEHYGCMTPAELEEYFDIETNAVSEAYIDWLLERSTIDVETKHDKCTIVTVQLPNDFVLVESSACVSPEKYSEDDGVEICMKKIKDKLWELEGYLLQQKLHDQSRKVSDIG